MSLKLINILLSVFVLQATKECFAANPHPFANLQFTPKEEYFNNYPTGQPASFSYAVPFCGSPRYPAPYPPASGSFPPPPPPPQRYVIQEPVLRNPNYINDEEDCFPNNPKNAFKPPKGHFLDKRDVLIRPKVVQKPAPLPANRPKVVLERQRVFPPGPPGPPGKPCNCNLGYY